MTYCIQHEAAGYVYVNMAKAACTSIKQAIAEHKGVDFETLMWNRPHHQRISFALSRPHLYRFTVVRHPASRLVSCWADWLQPPYPDVRALRLNPDLARLRGISCAEFIRHACGQIDGERNEHYAIQWRQLFCRGQLVVDDIYRMESLGDVWPVLQERFGLPDLPHIRTSSHAPWRDYYDAELRAMVERAYHEDFANLGYEW